MQLQLFDKHLDTLALAINPSVNFLAFEGTARSSKTVDSIQCFYLAVKSSNDYLHCIACKDYNAIRDNVLECNGLGLNNRNLFPDIRIAKDKIGGYYLTMRGYDRRKKKILLAGYANKNTWKVILGKTIGCFLIDEVNLCSQNFLNESFSRQLASDRPFHIVTLNGDDPQHFVYQEHINYCKPLGKVPVSILEDMNKVENKPGYYYYHWNFNDNPTMTEDKIKRAYSIYPVGSYYYKTKILGERGVAEGLIYALLAENPSKFILNEIPFDNIIKINIGVDFGGNGSNHTFVATGFTRGYQMVIHLESVKLDGAKYDPASLDAEFIKFCKMLTEKYASIIKRTKSSITAFCDSADQLQIRSFKRALEKNKVAVSVANARKGEINERIKLGLRLLQQGRLFFMNYTAQTCIHAYSTAVYNSAKGHEGERLDDGTSDIDTMDASEYSIEKEAKILIDSMGGKY